MLRYSVLTTLITLAALCTAQLPGLPDCAVSVHIDSLYPLLRVTTETMRLYLAIQLQPRCQVHMR